jgi:hypothetical protein
MGDDRQMALRMFTKVLSIHTYHFNILVYSLCPIKKKENADKYYVRTCTKQECITIKLAAHFGFAH